MAKRILSILAILLVLSTSVAAHPGRTDANGGHTNRSTGEYHYHHGYPEHQHTNGICPYDFDDKTGQNSGSSSSKNSSQSKSDNVSSSVNAEPAKKKKPSLFLVLLVFSLVYFLAASAIEHKKREDERRRLDAMRQQAEREEIAKRKAREEEERRIQLAILQAERDGVVAQCGGKTRTQIAIDLGMPTDLYIDKNDLPHDIPKGDAPDRCTVYVARNASVYHKSNRCRNVSLSPTNIIKVRHLEPCRHCVPMPDKIDLDWYIDYQKTMQLMRKHGITPAEDDDLSKPAP